MNNIQQLVINYKIYKDNIYLDDIIYIITPKINKYISKRIKSHYDKSIRDDILQYTYLDLIKYLNELNVPLHKFKFNYEYSVNRYLDRVYNKYTTYKKTKNRITNKTKYHYKIIPRELSNNYKNNEVTTETENLQLITKLTKDKKKLVDKYIKLYGNDKLKIVNNKIYYDYQVKRDICAFKDERGNE
jgi:hypothetical protein